MSHRRNMRRLASASGGVVAVPAYKFRPPVILSAMARNGDAAAKAELERRAAVAKALRAVGA